MTEGELHELFLCVPVGEENAMTAREIWREFGSNWSPDWADNKLRNFHSAGSIARVKRMTPRGYTWLWYRPA